MRRFSIGFLVSFLAVAVLAPVSFSAQANTRKPVSSSASKKVVGKHAKVLRKTATKKNNARSEKLASAKQKRKSPVQRVAFATALSGVPPLLSAGDLAGLSLTRDPLDLKSNVALVLDQSSNEVLFEKNSAVSLPIASITKLMTSLVVVEAAQDLNELLLVTEDDVDREKFSHSRLRVGHGSVGLGTRIALQRCDDVNESMNLPATMREAADVMSTNAATLLSWHLTLSP